MQRINRNGGVSSQRMAIVLLFLLLVTTTVDAQDGDAGIEAATELVTGYFGTAQYDPGDQARTENIHGNLQDRMEPFRA